MEIASFSLSAVGVNGTSTLRPGYLQVLCNDSAVHLRDHMAQFSFRPVSLSSPLCVRSKLAASDPGPALSSICRSEEEGSAQISGSQPQWGLFAGFVPVWLFCLSSRLLPCLWTGLATGGVAVLNGLCQDITFTRHRRVGKLEHWKHVWKRCMGK